MKGLETVECNWLPVEFHDFIVKNSGITSKSNKTATYLESLDS